ncbi:uncharacterized protein BJX67DRAFT_355110 [Aspergillus lucknowensis]|uniref:Uncharacterized protein n=1 Tax=Aspergillus lucknowensis TaxID=176173 RepID=A0ABR4LPU3_9EURO
MSPTTIFLVGAPTFSSLRWDEGGLLSESIPPFQSLNAAGEIGAVSPETDAVKWRLLRRPIIPETPQTTALSEAPGAAQFLITHDLATSNTVQTVISEDSELSQFYDHSFTIHETSEFSDLGPPTQDSVLGSSLWAASTETSLATNDEGETPPLRPSIRGGVTNLQDIPSASYLISIEPQTMTVNIIVAIITIRPPRRIVTRQWGKELDLIEAVVGDETRTGFGVTFWLPPQSDGVATHGSDNQRGEDLRKALMLLRPRDIVYDRPSTPATGRCNGRGRDLQAARYLEPRGQER